MITGNERLVIVLGMAHSGTTILTYILQQHPDIACFTDGNEAWILENTWLPTEQSEPIQQIINRTPVGKRVLLKRPWASVHHPDFLVAEMPNAKFLYCQRPVEDIAVSWSKPHSFVDDTLRHNGLQFQQNFYNVCLEAGLSFGARVPNFRVSHHLDFLARPKQAIDEITYWLGLAPHAYDVSQVSESPLYNIKHFLWSKRDFLPPELSRS